jgi:hypothetical protein
VPRTHEPSDWPECATLRSPCGQEQTRAGKGDWLSGRAPRSHRGGHWFDPSIAHRETAGQGRCLQDQENNEDRLGGHAGGHWSKQWLGARSSISTTMAPPARTVITAVVPAAGELRSTSRSSKNCTARSSRASGRAEATQWPRQSTTGQTGRWPTGPRRPSRRREILDPATDILGQIVLRDLTADQVSKALIKLAQARSPRTVRDTRANLVRVITYAQARGLVSRNVASLVCGAAGEGTRQAE